MNPHKTKLLITSILALTLTACATIEEKLTENGATRLDAQQVKSHIAGKTEKWSKGAGYYNPNGTLETLWEGVNSSGTYTIAADGNVCYEVETWEKECHFYMNDNGEIIMIYKGKNVGTHELQMGNQLSSL